VSTVLTIYPDGRVAMADIGWECGSLAVVVRELVGSRSEARIHLGRFRLVMDVEGMDAGDKNILATHLAIELGWEYDGTMLYGPVVFAGQDRGEVTGLTPGQVRMLEEKIGIPV